jgi:transcriptional regulator NrdR family protein
MAVCCLVGRSQAKGEKRLNCPICEGKVWSTVEDTRAKEGFTLRRRQCGNGHKFTTEEHVKLQNVVARKSSGVRAASKRKNDPAE